MNLLGIELKTPVNLFETDSAVRTHLKTVSSSTEDGNAIIEQHTEVQYSTTCMHSTYIY